MGYCKHGDIALFANLSISFFVFSFLPLGLWQNSFNKVVKCRHIFKSNTQILWSITYWSSHNFLGYRRSVVPEVWYRMISSTNLLRDHTWFLWMSSKPSKDVGYMTCNNAGKEVLCRKYIFIVNHLFCHFSITFLQYLFVYQLIPAATAIVVFKSF